MVMTRLISDPDDGYRWKRSSYQHNDIDGNHNVPPGVVDHHNSIMVHDAFFHQQHSYCSRLDRYCAVLLLVLLGCSLSVGAFYSIVFMGKDGSAPTSSSPSSLDGTAATSFSMNVLPTTIIYSPSKETESVKESHSPSMADAVSSSSADAKAYYTKQGRREAILQILSELQEQLDGNIYYSKSTYHHHHHHGNGDVDHGEEELFRTASTVWVANATGDGLPPLAIIEVSNERDVQIAIPILVQLSKGPWRVPFRIRSGGHHKAGYSTISDGIVLSLVRMNQLSIVVQDDPDDDRKQNDPASVRAIMGPSIRSGDVVEQAIYQWGYGGVIGFCGYVAESGFALGGGWGIQTRMYGLGLDQIVSVNIVLADGTLLSNVSSTPSGMASSPDNDNNVNNDHSDLFWALRGAGGGNFGVVTQIEYVLHPTHTEIMFVGIRFDDPNESAYSMYRIGELQHTWPGNLCVMIGAFMELQFLWTGQNQSMFDEGLSFIYDEVIPSVVSPKAIEGDRFETRGTIMEWIDMTSPPVSATSSASKQSISALAREFTGKNHQNVSDWGRSVWKAKCWTGFLHPVNNTLPNMEKIIRTMNHGAQQINDEIGTDLLMPHIELWGGAMNRAAAWNETAFPYRSALYNVGVLLMIPVDHVNPKEVYARVVKHVQSWWPEISQFLTGSYINYPDIDLVENQAYLDMYFGDNLPRLVDIKRKYDPDNVFEFPMSIPTKLVDVSS